MVSPQIDMQVDTLIQHARKEGINPIAAKTIAEFYIRTLRQDAFEDFSRIMSAASPIPTIEHFRRQFIRPEIESGKLQKVWGQFGKISFEQLVRPSSRAKAISMSEECNHDTKDQVLAAHRIARHR